MNGQKLEYLAKRQGYTAYAVAEMLGIDESTYWRKRNGKSDFTRNEIRILKEVLNLTLEEVDEIFFGKELA